MDEGVQISRHHIRGSILLLIFRVIGVAFLIDTIYAFFLMLAVQSPADYLSLVVGTLWALHTVKFLIETGLIVWVVTQWATTSYYLTEETLVRVTGITQIHEELFSMNNIRAVRVHESIWGKLLGYGSVVVSINTVGRGEEVWLQGVTNPRKYERLFKQYMKGPTSPISNH